MRFYFIVVTALAVGSLSAQTLDCMWESNGALSNGGFGLALTSIQDLDGDGFRDIVVGAPFDNGGAFFGGRCRILSGATGATLRDIIGTRPSARLGASVDTMRDVTGDGVEDLVIGSQHDDEGGTFAGAVDVRSGADSAVWLRILGPAMSHFGTAVLGHDDIDQDLSTDFVVGAPRDPAGGFNAGSVSAYNSRNGTLLWRRQGTGANHYFGSRLAAIEDLNEDGIKEIIVGSNSTTALGFFTGSVQILSGQDGTILLNIEGSQAGARFGEALTSIPDRDGDGLEDIAIGIPGATIGTEDFGRVEFRSSITGALLDAIDGDAPNARFGASVLVTSDVDGDQELDFVVGSDRETFDGLYRGRVRVFGLSDLTLRAVASGESAGDSFGTSVIALDDFNGDGITELAAAAINDNLGFSLPGSVRRFAVAGFWEYGAPDGLLRLSVDPTPIAGRYAVTIRGGEPFGPAALALSQGADAISASTYGVPVFVDIFNQQLLGTIPFVHSALGTFTFEIEISDSTIGDRSFFLQGFDLAGAPTASNGLEIRLSR